MGELRPKMGNATYCSAGQLSPLLNDPYFKTIGIGTRIFLGGGIGHVFSNGTQHTTTGIKRTKGGVPIAPSGTLAVHGDLKGMSPEWIRGASFTGYGVTLAVGIGVPIPVLNEEIAKFLSVKDEDLLAQIVDYSSDYPQGKSNPLGRVSYKELKSGTISLDGKDIPTSGLSSYYKARQICLTLKSWIEEGKFLLAEPVAMLPSEGSGVNFKGLKIRK